MTDSNQRVDLTGRVLMNKLRVERLLGEGGMGAVYEVEHLITKHRRALKVMHGKLAANAETIARFIREAGVAGTLRTPYVVETFDAGQLDDARPTSSWSCSRVGP
jgi:serine/threonine protein kinase